jgi:hypothetical protein
MSGQNGKARMACSNAHFDSDLFTNGPEKMRKASLRILESAALHNYRA